jgi:carboxyl-terminal processing protease
MSQPARPPLWFFAAIWLLVVGAFALGAFVARRSNLPEPQFTALQVVLQEIVRSHVDEQDPGRLLDIATKAMASFDHYGQYVPAGEVSGYVEATTGNYAGIGVSTLPADGRLLVRFPFADGPASRAGLEPGDEIVAVDGVAIGTLGADERLRVADARIRGQAGTKVGLTIARGEEPPRTVEVERAEVHKPCAKWAHFVDPARGIGYLWLSDFYRGADVELGRALDRLAAEPGGLRGLVLDLRFNGGGYLDPCIAIANLFLARGTIVTVRRRGSVIKDGERSAVPEQCRFPELPLAVLVNQDSASASEVLTGALQDHRRAVVVGELTYGKGMVNTEFRYSNFDFRLKVTTGHYFTPDGRDLEGHFLRKQGERKGGIEPDRAVSLAGEPLRAVYSALQDQEPPPALRAAVEALLARYGQRAPGIVPPAADPQLEAAIAAVREKLTAEDGHK